MFPFPPVLGVSQNSTPETPTPPPRPWWYDWLWRGKPAEAFWTLAAVLSMGLNILLIVALFLLARYAFTLKQAVEDQLLGGLAANFAAMDEAVIRTTVVVEDTIPVQFDLPVAFDLPIETETEVVLTENVYIQGAMVEYLATGGLVIRNAPANIVLPAGQSLPVRLNMVVPVRVTIPVDTRIPIRLQVPVAIPLKDTELHQPFVGLQEVIRPYQELLAGLPDSWEEVWCGSEGKGMLCGFYRFFTEK